MSERLNILIVDDEPGMRMGAQRVLDGFNFRLPESGESVAFHLDVAETGEQALEKVAAGRPDIVLLDHKLPGISGLDVLDKIASDATDVLTIMITAYASLEVAVSATKRGAYDFLAKPFTPDELRNAVRKAAGHILLTRQARRLAEEKRQVRFQFISVLAHELKAPLNAVTGYLEIIQNRAAGEDLASYDQAVGRSLVRTEQMRKLIADLLDLTRIESGQKVRELSEVDLIESANTAIETAAPAAEERDITIQLITEGPATMQADPGELDIIMNNLVSNAVKYNRDGGDVRVEIRTEEDQVLIEVADTGIGMSAEDTERLFNDFVRIRNEKTKNILGSGLGLSIVKKLALLYEGDVDVASIPDVGTTFTVRLARWTQPQADDAAAEAEVS